MANQGAVADAPGVPRWRVPAQPALSSPAINFTIQHKHGCPNHSPCPLQGLSDLDVATFCQKCVEPMGEESDHVHLVALTDALQVRGGGGSRGMATMKGSQ